MFLKWLAVFLGFGTANGLFLWLLFRFLDYVKAGKFLGMATSSYFLFPVLFLLVMTPIVYFSNYVFLTSYRLGYHWFDNKLWPVQIIMWVSGPIMFFFLAWFKKGELPSKGSLVALGFVMTGALINIFWK